MASVGVLALGAAVFQTSNAQGIGDSKPWTISAALRGFYDDNVTTANQNEIDTLGFEISPSVGFSAGLDQTTFSLAYTYSYKWYDENPNFDNHDDQTHTFLASLTHAFNERTSIDVKDSFAIGQEPDLDENYASFQRLSGNNIRNYGAVKLNHQITPIFGMEVGYDNSFFDYDSDANSGLLDRIEQRGHLDGRWSLANNSVAFLGYAFENGSYTADQIIGVSLSGPVMSDARDYNAHYGYVGIEHTFRPDLSGSIRGGARFSDYYNSPDDESSVSPYLQASLRYMYAQDSFFQMGLSYDRSATDAYARVETGESITTDADAMQVYASVSHKITPDLTGSLIGTFQNNTYNGGRADGDKEQYYILSAALSYQFTPNIAGTLSYNYDHVESDLVIGLVDRSYNRNRVFLGAVFSY